jgi:hypothetical protein
MSEELRLLAETFGKGAAEMAAFYAPSIKRLTLAELVAFGSLIAEKDTDGAIKILHDKMTPEDLAAEKVSLAELTVMMADSNAEKRKIAYDILMSGLRAALSLILSFMLL